MIGDQSDDLTPDSRAIHELLHSLQDEIETDFSSVRTSFNELAARGDLSAGIKAELRALDQKSQKRRQDRSADGDNDPRSNRRQLHQNRKVTFARF